MNKLLRLTPSKLPKETRFVAFLASFESMRSLKDLTLGVSATELGYYFL